MNVCRQPRQNGEVIPADSPLRCCRTDGHAGGCHIHGMFQVVGLHLYRTAGQTLGCGRGRRLDGAA